MVWRKFAITANAVEYHRGEYGARLLSIQGTDAVIRHYSPTRNIYIEPLDAVRR